MKKERQARRWGRRKVGLEVGMTKDRRGGGFRGDMHCSQQGTMGMKAGVGEQRKTWGQPPSW